MVKKVTSKQDDVRKRVYEFIEINPELSKNEIVKHFMMESIPRSTLYNILKRKDNNILPERQVGSGRKAVKMTKKKIKQLGKKIDHQHGISQRSLAKKFNVNQSYICKTIKQKTIIRYHKKIKAPKRTPEQQSLVRPKCSKLVEIFRKKQVIIDDESYFGLSNCNISGNSGFYSSDVTTTPNDVKLKRKQKFEQKLLVWVAISPKGLSKHYVAPSGQAVNENVYIDKCLRSCLLPFIETVHKDDEIVFWPDLASSHYSKKVQEFLRSKNVEYVPRSQNIANVPELRPIEDFWNEIKRAVYANCWEAKNLIQLRNRINYCFKHVDIERVHRLGKESFTRVDTVRRQGMENL